MPLDGCLALLDLLMTKPSAMEVLFQWTTSQVLTVLESNCIKNTESSWELVLPITINQPPQRWVLHPLLDSPGTPISCSDLSCIAHTLPQTLPSQETPNGAHHSWFNWPQPLLNSLPETVFLEKPSAHGNSGLRIKTAHQDSNLNLLTLLNSWSTGLNGSQPLDSETILFSQPPVLLISTSDHTIPPKESSSTHWKLELEPISLVTPIGTFLLSLPSLEEMIQMILLPDLLEVPFTMLTSQVCSSTPVWSLLTQPSSWTKFKTRLTRTTPTTV